MPADFTTILILHGSFAIGSVTRQVARPEDMVDMLLLGNRDQIGRSKPGRHQSAGLSHFGEQPPRWEGLLVARGGMIPWASAPRMARH